MKVSYVLAAAGVLAIAATGSAAADPGRGGPGIYGLGAGSGFDGGVQPFRHSHHGHGRFGTGRFDDYGVVGYGVPDEAPAAVQAMPAIPADTSQRIDVRVHPTYSELPVYARTAAPMLHRISGRGHSVRVTTITFPQPATRDVDLTPRF